MENREVINDVLVHLFNEIMELEEQAIITEEFPNSIYPEAASR